MDNERTKDWLGLAALTIGGIIVFGFLYYAYLFASRPETYSADPGKEKIILARDEGRKIGSEKIVYKGLADDGSFTMAVILLEMDPDYPYVHRFRIREAKNGFSLVDHRFELISASRNRVRLWYIKDPQLLAMTPKVSAEAQRPWLGPKDAWGP